jgi:hypothetical protein
MNKLAMTLAIAAVSAAAHADQLVVYRGDDIHTYACSRVDIYGSSGDIEATCQVDHAMRGDRIFVAGFEPIVPWGPWTISVLPPLTATYHACGILTKDVVGGHVQLVSVCP